MASFNKITIVGYLGRDPEIRYSGQGLAVCSFSVATAHKKKDQSGDYQDQTTWFRVSVFGRQAEACNQYLHKGSQVYVDGRLSIDEYTDREGQKRWSAEIAANDVQFLGSKADASEQQHSAQSAAALNAQAPAAGKRETGPIDDGGDESEIPF